MSAIKNYFHDEICAGQLEAAAIDNLIKSNMSNGINFNVNIGRYLSEAQLEQITIFAFDSVREKIKAIEPDFNENNYTFAYDFLCNVNIKLIKKHDHTHIASTDLPDNGIKKD